MQPIIKEVIGMTLQQGFIVKTNVGDRFSRFDSVGFMQLKLHFMGYYSLQVQLI